MGEARTRKLLSHTNTHDRTLWLATQRAAPLDGVVETSEDASVRMRTEAPNVRRQARAWGAR